MKSVCSYYILCKYNYCNSEFQSSDICHVVKPFTIIQDEVFIILSEDNNKKEEND